MRRSWHSSLPFPGRSRRHRRVLTSAIASLALILSAILFLSPRSHLQPKGIDSTSDSGIQAGYGIHGYMDSLTSGMGNWWSLRTPYCGPGGMARGKWRRREKPLTTIDDVREAWALPPNMHTECPAFSLIDSPEQRTIQVAGWDWKADAELEGKCEVAPWTVQKLTIRLLRAKQGLVMIGDSLTNNLYESYEGYFKYPNTPFLTKTKGLIFGCIWLDPSHPDTPRLLELAGVPASRLHVPLLTWWRHHHLLSKDELEQVHSGIDLYKLKDEPKEPDWWPLYLVQRAEAYAERENSEIVVPGYEDPAPSARKTEKDVVILNVGAHWSGGELGWDMKRDDELLGYLKMVEFLSTRFKALQPAVNVYWRSVAPGHVQCDQYTEPEPERTNELSTKDPTAKQYNWDLLRLMNDIVENHVAYDPLRAPLSPDSAKTTVDYIDIWNMSIQRPDAHLNPGGDCLHFCPIGVTTQWIQFQWQAMLYDSKYKDY